MRVSSSNENSRLAEVPFRLMLLKPIHIEDDIVDILIEND